MTRRDSSMLSAAHRRHEWMRLVTLLGGSGHRSERPLSTHLGRSPQSSRGSLGGRAAGGFAYSGRSLTRISPALTSNTLASATAGPAPCRTSAVDQLVWPGGR